MLRILILLFLSLSSSLLIAQQEVTDTEIIQGVAKYRSAVIDKSEEFDLFKSIIELLILHGATTDDIENMFYMLIGYADLAETDVDIYGLLDPGLINKLTTIQNNDGEVLSEEDLVLLLNSLYNNRQIIDLVNAGVIKPLPPHALNSKSDIFKEIKFYGFRHGDVIADIGSSTGDFSFIIAMIVRDEELFTTEIRDTYLTVLEEKRQVFSEIIDTTRFHVVRGEEEFINLEKNYFDKIILRSTLHHCEKKKAILSDIYLCLKDGGHLLVEEVDGKILDKAIDEVCSKAIRIKKVQSLIEKAGFILDNKMILDGTYYFVYQK